MSLPASSMPWESPRQAFSGTRWAGWWLQAFAFRNPDRVDRLMLGATAAKPIARLRLLTRLAFWLGRAIARFSKKESVRFTYTFLTAGRVLDPAHGRWMWNALLDRDPTLYYEVGQRHLALRFPGLGRTAPSPGLDRDSHERSRHARRCPVRARRPPPRRHGVRDRGRRPRIDPLPSRGVRCGGRVIHG